ncbi:hypothetical protein K402DRAFT_456588 [Aulographum hederae CBS 113979]|uniref:Uncharacterized protein n=1 Tax=Aulographum hederae CBS 113979 TaxID=1176131 RepID=A0A6G1GR29_9PEZI|nr:hypothetical protein K402DRAFT_456588 [Aulographum hederae CBS 113979]
MRIALFILSVVLPLAGAVSLIPPSAANLLRPILKRVSCESTCAKDWLSNCNKCMQKGKDLGAFCAPKNVKTACVTMCEYGDIEFNPQMLGMMKREVAAKRNFCSVMCNGEKGVAGSKMAAEPCMEYCAQAEFDKMLEQMAKQPLQIRDQQGVEQAPSYCY